MTARAASATAEAPAAGSGPVVVAQALPAPEDGLRRVGWPLTIWRLALEPAVHPWSARWRLRRRGPIAAVVVAAILLLLLAASGCSSAPLQSLRSTAVSPAPAQGLRCESVLVSQEVQVPPEGELADVRLTIDDLPPVTGKLRLLVRRPRFSANLEIAADQKPEFDKVLDLSPGAGQRSLTVVLSRPRRAHDDWPRRECKACRVDVELTGLFGAREALGAFFSRAMEQAAAIDGGFGAQAARNPASRPDAGLRETAEAMIAEANRCGVPLAASLRPALDALARLDAARALLYSEDPALPDVAGVLRAWDSATHAMEGIVAASARAAGWPSSLRVGSAGRLGVAAVHLDAAAQLASLAEEDRRIAARFIGLALAGDPAVQKRRLLTLPPIRDLDDAQARLDWVNARPGSSIPIPGLTHPAAIHVRHWVVPIRGKRCIGPGGAAPVRNAEEDAAIVGRLLGGDRQRVRIASPDDIPQAREALRRSEDLLCEAQQPEVADLFQDLADKDLGPIAARLEEIFTRTEPRREQDEVTRAVLARASQLLCKVFDAENLKQRLATVAGYRVFVEGGTRILEVLPQPLICGSQLLTPREKSGGGCARRIARRSTAMRQRIGSARSAAASAPTRSPPRCEKSSGCTVRRSPPPPPRRAGGSISLRRSGSATSGCRSSTAARRRPVRRSRNCAARRPRASSRARSARLRNPASSGHRESRSRAPSPRAA